MIIVLLGYMASGKTTIGQKIAEVLNYEFIDLDHYIEENENQTIAQIFDTKGEIFFRKQEATMLDKVLQYHSNLVLSLGGGTPCYAGNMDRIKNRNNTVTFYLKASIPTIVARLKDEKTQRPLVSHLTKDDELIEFIGKHLFERRQFYELSNVTITTDNKSLEEITNEIVKTIPPK